MEKAAIIISLALVITWYTVSYIQDTMTFNPSPLPLTHDFGIEYHDENLKTVIDEDITLTEHFIKKHNKSNKDKLNALYLNNNQTDNFIIYFHGNSGSIHDCISIFYDLGKYGSILLFDYSGYGKSTGITNTNNICDDAFSIYLYVTRELGVNADNIILYGFSLGGAVASHLTTRIREEKKDIKAIIIQSTFANPKEMAKKVLPGPVYHCLKYFIDNTFSSDIHLEKLSDKTKLLVVHSKDDEMIGFHHGQQLSKSRNNSLVAIKGSHNLPIFTNEFWSRFTKCLQ